MLTVEVWGLLVLGLLLGFANIGGIGGGGLIIPVSMAMFGFTTKNAVAISNSTIFAGALIRFFMFSIWQRHPTKADATLIDYSLASVMIPAVLIGSYAGILVNVAMPETVLQIVLTLLLLYITYESFSKAITKYRAENKQKVTDQTKEQLLNDDKSATEQTADINSNMEINSPTNDSSYTTFARDDSPHIVEDTYRNYNRSLTPNTALVLLEDIQNKEQSNVLQWPVHLCAASCVAIAFVTSLLRGSPKSTSIIGIDRCGVLDWSILAAFFTTMVLFIVARVSIVREE